MSGPTAAANARLARDPAVAKLGDLGDDLEVRAVVARKAPTRSAQGSATIALALAGRP